MFDKSALIVAHPDDEALWFSSIVERVDEVVVCFTEITSRPDWSEGRRKSMESYPLGNAVFLGLQEAEVFNGTDWQAPVTTRYGLEVSKRKDSFPGFSAKRYQENYSELRQRLSTRLKGCRNVITHNPWGEYGHEEHVQVFRAIQDLQREFGFNVWFSNYCSNKSYHLMLQHVSGYCSSYVTIECNREIWKNLMLLYKKNNCWTWFEDYTLFTHECFMLSNKEEVNKKNIGHIFPLNFIKLDLHPGKEDSMKWSVIAQKMLRRWRNQV